MYKFYCKPFFQQHVGKIFKILSYVIQITFLYIKNALGVFIWRDNLCHNNVRRVCWLVHCNLFDICRVPRLLPLFTSRLKLFTLNKILNIVSKFIDVNWGDTHQAHVYRCNFEINVYVIQTANWLNKMSFMDNFIKTYINKFKENCNIQLSKQFFTVSFRICLNTLLLKFL